MQRVLRLNAECRATARRGYSLIEVTICVLIVGGMFAAAIHTLGAVRLSERQTLDRSRAHMLAEALMDEMIQQDYDEVSNYDGRSHSPPIDREGMAMPGFTGWTRNVEVRHVDLDEPDQPVTDDTGLKHITVTVKRGDAMQAQLVALRGRGLHKERPTGAIAP